MVDLKRTQVRAIEEAYGGLKGRTIDAAGSRHPIRPYQPCAANEITAKTSTTLEKIEVDLTSLVKELLEPVFILGTSDQVLIL